VIIQKYAKQRKAHLDFFQGQKKVTDKGTCSNSRQESTVNMHSCIEEDIEHYRKVSNM